MYLVLNKEIFIYTGPSLTIEETKTIAPDAKVFPPAKRGDLVFDPGETPKIIVLIDGALHNTLTVSPREIRELLDQGVIIFGASSIGAIRAVELRYLGMKGVGEVYKMYLSGEVIADDEVIMAMNPDDHTPLSEPLIHIRYLLKEAYRRDIITLSESDLLLEEMKDVYFPDRSIKKMLNSAKIISETKSDDLRRLSKEIDYKIKRIDAINAIKLALII